LEGSDGGTEPWEGIVFNLLDADADCFLRKGILSFVVDVLAALAEGRE